MASFVVVAATVSAMSLPQNRHFAPKADNASGSPFLVFPFYNVDLIDSVFEDISPDGTLAQVTTVDDPTPTRPDDMVALPFTFPYFEKNVTNIFIDPNGFISTLSQICYSAIGFCNWGFPTPRYAQFMGPLMSDWAPQMKPYSFIHYRIDNNPNVQRLIVQYTNISLSALAPMEGDFTFQVIIASDGTIQFNYQSLPYDPQLKTFTFDLLDGTNITLPYPSFIGLQGSILGRTSTNRLVLLAPYPFVSVPFTSIKTETTTYSVKFTPRASCSQFKNCSSCVAHFAPPSPYDLPCGWCQATMSCVNLPSNLDPSATIGLCPNVATLGTADAQCMQFNATACNATGWPVTQPGTNTSRSCPEGFKGFETRSCDIFGVWGNITSTCTEVTQDEISNATNGVQISKGGIAGIVIGCVFGVAILLGLAIFLWKKRSELAGYRQMEGTR